MQLAFPTSRNPFSRHPASHRKQAMPPSPTQASYWRMLGKVHSYWCLPGWCRRGILAKITWTEWKLSLLQSNMKRMDLEGAHQFNNTYKVKFNKEKFQDTLRNTSFIRCISFSSGTFLWFRLVPLSKSVRQPCRVPAHQPPQLRHVTSTNHLLTITTRHHSPHLLNPCPDTRVRFFPLSTGKSIPFPSYPILLQH